MRKLILPLVLLVVALGITVKLTANKKKLNAAKQPVDRSAIAIPVTVMTAAEGSVSGTFSVAGTLEPYDHAKVMVNAQGKLASLSVDLGSRVSKGQVLGSLDVAGKQLELEAAELSLAKLQKDHDRYKELYAGKAASEVNYDDARFQYENARVKVDQIRQQLRDAQVIAPVGGTVVAKNVEVGEYVPANTAVVEVVDIARLKANVFVSERDAYRVQPGRAVEITTDIYPGERFPGKVTFVSPRGDASHNYEVEVAVDNSKAHPLKSGTFVTATFTGSEEGQALMIPKTALAEGMKNAYVFVVDRADSTFRSTQRKLTLGREVGDAVEVVDGLKPGDTVVLTGQLNLGEGTLVRITGR
ncbi:MAG: efflux RND transporter periplasmic adaptor subunit [Flavobacteriales bacterium]